MFAIRDERTEVRMTDFEEAMEKITRDDSPGTPIAFY